MHETIFKSLQLVKSLVPIKMIKINIIVTLVLSLTIYGKLFSQDGSNIRYTKVKNLDKTHIGQICHLDFYQRSFRGLNIDTISIDLNGETVGFQEHREDSGYNNWFDKQYLEATEAVSEHTIRIIHFRINDVTGNTICVTGEIRYYDNNGNVINQDENTLIEECFPKKIIAEVLMKK